MYSGNIALKMSNDDSLNDSEELISLYSSKKITDTFNARLKKIAANNHVTHGLSTENREEVLSKKADITDDRSRKVIEKNKMDIAFNESIEILNDNLLNPSVVIDNDISLEDQIEIIAEYNARSTRQSDRLRKKREQGNCMLNQTLNFSLDISANKINTRYRNKIYKKKKFQKQKPLEITLNDSPEKSSIDDELNPELSVKVIWKSVGVKKFQIRKFQKLSYIFQLLSKEENIPEDKIILNFNNVRVNKDDTPDTLNLQVYHFLDGGVLNELCDSYQTSNPQNFGSNSDCVSLKFQDFNQKIVILNLSKNEKLKVGMIKCSEQLEVPLNKIKFFFDGELLEPSETPASLGLENEEVIDLKICS